MKVDFYSFDFRQSLKDRLLKAFEEFFNSNSYILGSAVQLFENQYANYCGVRHAIGVSNGLDALHLSLESLGVGEGDEVIVPANTFIATVLAITYTGARPVFVEPKIDTYNINPNGILDKINDRTRVIIPVHLYGQACEMKEILDISSKYGIHIIEDNAQSQGAEWNGRRTGSFGICNATSFYPAKNLGALGDAGAITTDSDSISRKLRSLRNYGSAVKYINSMVGYNHRLDECQAVFLSIFLEYLDDWNSSRQDAARMYIEGLKDIDEIVLPTIAEGCTSVYHLFVIRCNQRDSLQEYLKNRGISTLVHYPIPAHLQNCYRQLGYKKGAFPITELISNTCLSLPLYPGISPKSIEFVVGSIKDFYTRISS